MFAVLHKIISFVSSRVKCTIKLTYLLKFCETWLVLPLPCKNMSSMQRCIRCIMPKCITWKENYIAHNIMPHGNKFWSFNYSTQCTLVKKNSIKLWKPIKYSKKLYIICHAAWKMSLLLSRFLYYLLLSIYCKLLLFINLLIQHIIFRIDLL